MPPQSTSTKIDAPQVEVSESRVGVTQRKVANVKEVESSTTETAKEWNPMEHILWMNVFWFTILHVGAVYGTYLTIFSASWKTFVFAFFTYKLSLFGITAGVHRLWSHRAYKARLPLRIFLAFCNSVSYQNSIYEWARDHRVHHKFTETNADPVNSKRGFFFSHVGWLCCKKHPDVKLIGGKVDMSDILNDPVVYYQKKYYVPSVIVCFALLPTVIPWYYWGESLWNAYWVAVILRYCFALNATWLVNSAAHMYGDRPYDKNIAPAENITVSALTLGEGYHNFHHTFPFDYTTSEWGYRINITTAILDFFSLFGLAYGFRQATPEMIKARIARTGKSGHEVVEEHEYM
ncbi:Stearoyl-CoA desaturase 5 [Orchesella cincta]|uniref:Stearoyl-CoA desaturase 5 n=1 Tax=Orchesella cincta TaxID=48709 RepID=A0A1D2MPX3_ORCCI|nr:Stearoyl-CoA desaturase 5 [Orchesella cincta]